MADGANGRRAGERIGGYTLAERLGGGGFGEVYLGESGDGRRVAVKFLHAAWADDADMRRRFAAEVEQARRVSGLCIAPVGDADLESPRPWIASEYIDAHTPAAAVAAGAPRSGAGLHRLAVSTATALAAIHGAGVVHRDLKPENILLAADGPRVIDFGIARAVEATSVTASGVIGTVGYMAPEQLEGERLTPAVDVFAWGAVVVFAATGRDAFAAPSQAARIARVLSGEPDTAGIGDPLLSVIRSCLEKDPARRPTARALIDLLLGIPAEAMAPAGRPAPVGLEATRAPDGPDGVLAAERTLRTGDAPPGRTEERRSATLPFTRAAGPGNAGGPSVEAEVAPATGLPGRPQGSGGLPGPGGAAPYLFAGGGFTDPGRLAEAM